MLLLFVCAVYIGASIHRNSIRTGSMEWNFTSSREFYSINSREFHPCIDSREFHFTSSKTFQSNDFVGFHSTEQASGERHPDLTIFSDCTSKEQPQTRVLQPGTDRRYMRNDGTRWRDRTSGAIPRHPIPRRTFQRWGRGGKGTLCCCSSSRGIQRTVPPDPESQLLAA